MMKKDDLRDDVLAIVAHELCHPLAAIGSWTDVIRRREPTDPQLQRAVETIARCVRLQQRILDDLLDHVRIGRGQLHLERALVNVARLAADTAEAMSPIAAHQGIALDWPNSDRAPVHVHGDADRLRQVFSNLISNAIRHSGSGARVAVEVECVDGHALVRVSDSGRGIPPHLLPHLFERFRRGVASSRRGLGLGLAISRDIVKLHDGALLAQSDGEGRGATFTVCLPCPGDPV
jgi:signal transduction histidine kinase